MRSPLPAAVILALLPMGHAAGQAVLAPADWNMGRIEMGGAVSRAVTVTNPEQRPLTVSLVSTCGCLEAVPSRLRLDPGSTAEVVLRYTPEEPGKVDLYFVVGSVPEGGSAGTSRLYQVRGLVNPPGSQAGAREAAPGPGGAEAAAGVGAAAGAPAAAAGAWSRAQTGEMRFYYAPGCRGCERLLARLEERLAARAGGPAGRTVLARRNILEPAAFEELTAAAGESGLPGIPAVVVGGRILSGERSIEAGLEEALDAQAAAAPPAAPGASGPGGAAGAALAARLAAPALFAAGLVDGINPCAFTTIVFLLTSLVLAGRRRVEILLVGAGFTLAVFATYFMVGLGLFHSLRAAAAFPIAAAALRWLLVAVLVAFAGVSLYDYSLARKGRATEMVLRLPDPVKRRMQRTILAGTRSTALVGGSLVLGAAVSLFELACTGQIYLPAVAYLVRTQGGLAAHLLLAVYNVGFILPLAVVFVLAWRGMSSRRLAELAGAHVGAVKLALAAVFVGLAALTLAS